MSFLHLTRLWRLAFAASALFAIVMASLPEPPIPRNPPDTLLHLLAFAVLTVLARLGFPRARGWSIFLGLGALGAGIELIQAIPALNREASLRDWAVDMVAILAVLVVMGAFEWLAGGKAPATTPEAPK